MLTGLKIRRFKSLKDVDIELGRFVVYIGPNNSGKTAALQALALWNVGLQQWLEKRGGKATSEKRPGVAVNRKDLISVPIPRANLLWHDLHVRNIQRIAGGKQTTQNIRIDIIVDGITEGKSWSCGLEFDYANEESFYCRPLGLSGPGHPGRMPIPDGAKSVRVAFLPPMSGLAADEPKLEFGRINVLTGEGQTAQVLRNLCYQIYENNQAGWEELVNYLTDHFGVITHPPEYIKERGEITMTYKEVGGKDFDLSSSGRGFQQALLLLAHLYANPQSVLLLDEPDAHLEILRQRQIYQLITQVAGKQGSQIIAASHSEVILTEAADRDVVVAFVGKPHRIDDRGSQVLKSLKSIGFYDYYLAETTGWVLYLEGSTDLAILRAFAKILGHPASQILEMPFVYYVGNVPAKVSEHFWGLREAKTDLVGIAVFDRLGSPLPDNLGPPVEQWRRREIENYLCSKEVLLEYARHDQPNDLFGITEATRRKHTMESIIDDVAQALETLGKPSPWSPDIKVTDDFLDPLFGKYFNALALPNLMRKSDYHELASFVSRGQIDPEIEEKLDAIFAVAKKANPRKD